MTTAAEPTIAEALEFRLSPRLAGAVAAHSGLTVPGANDPGSESPLEQLDDAGLLLDDGTTLHPALRRALETIANPAGGLIVASCVPEQQSWRRLIAYACADGNGFAAGSTATGSTVIQSLPTIDDVAAVTAPDLQFEVARAAGVDVPTIELGLEGWSALLAIADVYRERELKALINRDTKAIATSFEARELANAATKGAKSQDLRWLTTLGIALTPGALAADANAMKVGLEQLDIAGLVMPEARGHGFTAAGETLLLLLRTLMVAGAVAGARPGEGAPMAVAGVLTSPLGVRAITWEGAGGDLRGALIPLNRAGYTALLGNLAAFATTGPAPAVEDETPASPPVEPDVVKAATASAPTPPTPKPKAPPFGSPKVSPRPAAPTDDSCASCGDALRPGARFCGGCGSSVPQEAVPAPAEAGITCAGCGASLLPAAKFCGGCGTAVDSGPATCNACANELLPGAKFCGSCGTPTA